MKILQSISLSVSKGELVCILGPSGSGKSTLLRCLIGLDEQFAGQLEIDKKTAQIYFSERRIALVAQQYANLHWKNVQENIATAFAYRKVLPQEGRNIVAGLLDELGLHDKGKSYMSQLSGGQQQRVAIGRALAQNTEIIAFDEPFGALDHGTRESLQVMLKRLNQRLHKTILFVTHDVEEAVFLADRIIVLTNSPAQIADTYDCSAFDDLDTSIKYDPDFIAIRKKIQESIVQQSKQK
ncbi:MAG: ABC transporter ATP-binding protein [Bacteroidota bacterium]